MVRSIYILLAAGVSVSATFPSIAEERLYASLLKRQDPGTPKYECHEKCGTVISIAKKGENVCENSDFVEAYNHCIGCAGPDKFDIWKYYGRSLGAVGEACGFETEPATTLEATQDPTPTPATPTSERVQSTGYEVPKSSVAPVGSPDSSTVAYATPSSSGIPYSSGNATSTYNSSLPPQVTDNAGSALELSNDAGIVGAVVFGIIYAL